MKIFKILDMKIMKNYNKKIREKLACSLEYFIWLAALKIVNLKDYNL